MSDPLMQAPVPRAMDFTEPAILDGAAGLPGKPDVVLPFRKIAIFVHGCFWHRHAGCHWCSTPATRPDFWSAKFEDNLMRDARVHGALHEIGWRVGIMWECGLCPPYVETMMERVISWIRAGWGDFDSGLVRPQEGQFQLE